MTAAMSKKREQWLSRRQNGIGASDAPAVLGVSPWQTATDLWAEKAGLVERSDRATDQMAWGTKLEKVVAEEFRARHPEMAVVNPGRYATVRHKEYPYLFATLDRRLVLEDETHGVLEIKTTSDRMSGQWEEEPPVHVLAQVQHQLLVSGLDWGIVAVLIGGSDYREFPVLRNERFLSILLQREIDFWRHVQEKTPPVESPSIALAQSLARLHPDDNGETVELGEEFVEITQEIEDLARSRKMIEDREKELKARIECAIGPATFGQLPDGSLWSWRTQERKGYTVEAGKSRVLRRKVVTK